MGEINSSIAFMIILASFGAGYWIVSKLFTKSAATTDEHKNSHAEQKYHSHEHANENRTEPPGQEDPAFTAKNIDYYSKLLALNGNHTVENIRRQYREQLSKYHPDKVSHLGHEFQQIAEQKTREIIEAYQFFQRKYNIN